VVELGRAGDVLAPFGGVEVDDLLRRLLVGKDNGVGGEDAEPGVQLVEEVQLVDRASDRVGKEQDVPLEPGHGCRFVFKASTERHGVVIDSVTL
jgi:hypothetical protein